MLCCVAKTFHLHSPCSCSYRALTETALPATARSSKSGVVSAIDVRERRRRELQQLTALSQNSSRNVDQSWVKKQKISTQAR